MHFTGASLGQLEDTIKEALHLHGRRLRLECWDADFEEWCNVVVEEPEWLPNKSKLKAHLAA